MMVLAKLRVLSERASDCRLMPSEQFISYIMVRTSYILMGLVYWVLMPLSIIFQLYRGSQFYWYVDGICFVLNHLDQQAELDFNSTHTMKQQKDMSLH